MVALPMTGVITISEALLAQSDPKFVLNAALLVVREATGWLRPYATRVLSGHFEACRATGRPSEKG